MADYVPVYTGGVDPFSATASAAITGGQLVENTGVNTVGPAGAASTKVVGVAAFDVASGGRVTVFPLAPVIHEVTASGTVTAGDGVAAAASGQVATVAVATGAAAGTLIGTAVTTATTGNKVRFIGRG